MHTISRGEGNGDGGGENGGATLTSIDWKDDQLKWDMDPMRQFHTTVHLPTKAASMNCDEAQDCTIVWSDTKPTESRAGIKRLLKRRQRHSNYREDDRGNGSSNRLTDGNQSTCHDNDGDTDDRVKERQ